MASDESIWSRPRCFYSAWKYTLIIGFLPVNGINFKRMIIKNIFSITENPALSGHSKLDFKTFFKLPFVLKTVVLSIFEWPLKRGFTVQGFKLYFQRTITCYLWNHQH